MKVKYLLKNIFVFLRGGVLEVYPQKQAGVRQQAWHQQQIDVPAVQFALGGENERANHTRTGIDEAATPGPVRPGASYWRTPYRCRIASEMLDCPCGCVCIGCAYWTG